MFILSTTEYRFLMLPTHKEYSPLYKKLFKFLSKILFTLSSRSACLFMPFFACFSLFRSYIARYAPLKNKKNTLKKFYKNFKDINLNNF